MHRFLRVLGEEKGISLVSSLLFSFYVLVIYFPFRSVHTIFIKFVILRVASENVYLLIIDSFFFNFFLGGGECLCFTALKNIRYLTFFHFFKDNLVAVFFTV